MLNMNLINQVIKYPKMIGCAAMAGGIVVAAQLVVEANAKPGNEWIIDMVDQILEAKKKKEIEEEKRWKEAAVQFELAIDKMDDICKKDMKNLKHHKIYEHLRKQQRQQQQKQHHHH